jgi:hypothetical protein
VASTRWFLPKSHNRLYRCGRLLSPPGSNRRRLSRKRCGLERGFPSVIEAAVRLRSPMKIRAISFAVFTLLPDGGFHGTPYRSAAAPRPNKISSVRSGRGGSDTTTGWALTCSPTPYTSNKRYRSSRMLKPWEDRHAAEKSSLRPIPYDDHETNSLPTLRRSRVVFSAPPHQNGLGNASGLSVFELQDRVGRLAPGIDGGPKKKIMQAIVAGAANSPASTRTRGPPTAPRFRRSL